MFKPYDFSALTSALRLYGLQYDLQPDSLKGFSETLQRLSFSGSTLINPVFSADASILDSVSSAPDMGAMAALFQSDPATIFAQALFTAMVDNGHVFEAQSNGCACCGHDHGMNAKTQIMKLSDQIQQLLDSGLDISNFSTLIGSISALGDVDADIFANSLQEIAEAFAKAIFDTANEPANSDLPADTSTTGTITIGGSASGTRGSGTDEDWYAVELQAGVQYTFIMLRDGDNPHEDPLLILYNPAGTEIDRNDDVEIDGARVNRNSFLTFTPGESGTYYLGASGWMATTGDYTIYAEEGNNRPDFTLDQAAFFLTSQFNNEAKWDKTDLTYDISALSDGAKTLALMAMDAWAEVSGLTFTAAAAGADPDIDFNEDTGDTYARQAFTSSITSNGTITSATVTVSANWDTNSDGSANYALNSLRYQTYLHEVGHALGLGHSGLYNGSSSDEAGVSYHVYNQDAWNYTVMSYLDQGEAGTGTPRLVLTPQLVDIIAIQNFYGANGQTRSGNSVYGFNSTETGVLDFEGTFFNQGIRPPSLAIYDAGGTDTLDFSGYSANQVISLVEGSFSSIGDNIDTDDPEDPLINNITIAVGTVIENAIGGSGDDSFIGNDSNNVFTGNGGNDTYVGGAGNDMVILALSQSRYTISVDETNGGRFLVIAGGTEGTDRINLADVEFVGFDSGQTIVTTTSLAGDIEFDFDEDGIIDRRVYRNADGRWTRVEFDTDDDGTIDRITHYAFDDGGRRRVTRREIDLDDDGTIDRTVHLNADGRWERLEQDLDDDGFIDRITHYAFDDDGNRRVTRRDFDRDDDGIPDRSEAYSYDEDGNRIRTRFDDDNDGTIDRTAFDTDGDGNIDRITHYAFDDGGTRSVTRRDFDLDDDGTINRTVHLNAEGRWERVEQDLDDDGFIDRITHYAFDDSGRRSVTRRDFDLDDDGIINQRVHLNADGRWEQVERDADDDGNIDRITHYAFDSDGNRSVTRTAFDLDDDGNIDRTVHLDTDGRWEWVEQDLDDDGFIDRITHYAFDGDGRRSVTRSEFDDDGDGILDRSEAYSYDGDGNRIRTRFDDDNDGTIDRTAFDTDGDGTLDRIIHYAFDGDGRRSVTRRDEDLDDDGIIDRTVHLDANGRWERVERDVDDDGIIDRINHYTFDTDGNRIRTDFDDDADGNIDRIAFDTDGDGTIDRSVTYTRNTNGNLIRTNFDDDANGTIDRSETYTRNTNGNLIRTNFDDDANGTIDRSETYTYNTNGNLIRTDFDDDADGRIDRTRETGAPPISRVALSSLNGTNGFILTGIDGGDGSGWSVSSVGDVNGDGYDDLIIGAPGGDPNGVNNAGETYIVYGGASAPGTDGVLGLSMLDGMNGFTLTGIDWLDFSGYSVSSAGDVNGDGYDDLIIGAYWADPNGYSEAGETYVVYGGARAPGRDGVLDLSALNGTNGFILTGIDRRDFSGFSVSSAGDVNGDGYDDLIIGAWGADPNGGRSGETYIVYGGASAPGTGGVLDLSDLDGSNGFILTGIDGGDDSGFSVSSAGDVNGDGYDDLIIGANRANPNGDSSGETYVIYGGARGPVDDNGALDLSDLDGTNGFTLTGIDWLDFSGSSVSSAGDVNGDGYDDLIIGAHFAGPNGNSSGETYLVYGGASAPGTRGVLDLGALDGSNGFTLTGIDAGDQSGFSVSSAGDVNSDGYDDLIIGAHRAAPNGVSRAGETYVVYGGASAPGTRGVLDLSDLDGTNGFILNGIDERDYSGFSVSSAGDVNGDGYDDLVIGARGADDFTGETYILYGGATGTESLTPVTAQGTAAADNFTGNAGDDSFTDIATDDVVRGGAGDDRISVTALDFAAIDGGTGVDTLVLDGAGLSLDLTGAGHASVDSVELFDLSGSGANSLVLDALAVFGVTEERAGGVASLDVLGDADDRVDLSGSSFALTGTATEDGVTYNVYRDGNAQLRIEDGVMVTLASAGAQSARSQTDTKTDTGIDPVADPRIDPGTDPESGTRLDEALMNPDPLMNNDLWDDLWADGVRSLDQPVHIDEDAILIPLSDPLSFGPLSSGLLSGPWGDLMCWPGLENHPAMQNDLAMILPEMEIVTAYMEGF